MTIENWIILALALVAAITWYVTRYLDRAMNMAQRRLDYRLKALEAMESLLPVMAAVQSNSAPAAKSTFLAQLEDTRSKFQIYGLSDEIALMEKFAQAIAKQNASEANAALGELVPLVRSRLRIQLNIQA